MDDEDFKVYPAPPGEPAADDFWVSVNGKSLFVHRARVSAFPINQIWPGYQRPLDQTELASFAYWDMSTPVDVEVISRRPVRTVEVRPYSSKIRPLVDGNRITFALTKPSHLTIEVNGTHHALHLFVNPIEEKCVNLHDPNVKYFGTGIHQAGKIELKSGETVYIDGGAVIHGAIEAKGAAEIKILGRGILDTSTFNRGDRARGSIYLYQCSDVEIDGIVLRDPNVWTVTPAA